MSEVRYHQSPEFRKEYNARPERKARMLVSDARKREKLRGVPEDMRLPLEAWRYVLDQIEAGEYVIRTGRGSKRHPLTPSLSRIDHDNPRYADNFKVEYWIVNAMKQNFDPTELREAAKVVDLNAALEEE